MYVRLTERLGLNDHLMVLSVMLTKIATNLKLFGGCEEVISLTLALLQVALPKLMSPFSSRICATERPKALDWEYRYSVGKGLEPHNCESSI